MTDLVSANLDYSGTHGDIVALLENGRRVAAGSVNFVMTAIYCESVAGDDV